MGEDGVEALGGVAAAADPGVQLPIGVLPPQMLAEVTKASRTTAAASQVNQKFLVG